MPQTPIDPLTLRFCEQHPQDAARVISGLALEHVNELFRTLPVALAARLITHMATRHIREQLYTLDDAKAAEILLQLDQPQLIQLMALLDDARQTELLKQLPEEKASQIGNLIQFSEPPIAAILDSNPLTITVEMTVAQALTRLKAAAKPSNGEVFILDQDQRLAGGITIHALLGADRQRPVSQIMRRHIPVLSSDTPLHEAADHPVWKSFCVAPVTDRAGLFLGVLPSWTLRSHLKRSTPIQASQDNLGFILTLAEGGWNTMANVFDFATRFKQAPHHSQEP